MQISTKANCKYDNSNKISEMFHLLKKTITKIVKYTSVNQMISLQCIGAIYEDVFFNASLIRIFKF